MPEVAAVVRGVEPLVLVALVVALMEHLRQPHLRLQRLTLVAAVALLVVLAQSAALAAPAS